MVAQRLGFEFSKQVGPNFLHKGLPGFFEQIGMPGVGGETDEVGRHHDREPYSQRLTRQAAFDEIIRDDPPDEGVEVDERNGKNE